MNKINYFFYIFIFLGMLCLATHLENNQSKQRIAYIESYRYKKIEKQSQKEFREYEVLIKSLVKVYIDFTSMGSQHFTMDNLEYMNFLLSKTSLIQAIFMLADRMVKNIAFVPGFYEIDIKSGMAIDNQLFLEK